MDISQLTQFNPWWTERMVPAALLGSQKRPYFDSAKKNLENKFIILLYGLRRVGKTTILYQIIQELLNKKVNPLSVLYFSFDEQTANIKEIISLYEEKVIKTKINNGKENCFCFFDEIQKTENWQNQIKILYDTHPGLKIFISGSSSLSLQKQASESLAGRLIDILVKPLGFAEFLEWQNIKINLKNPEIYQTTAQPLLMDYLRKGGFPEITGEKDDGLIKTYLKNAILERIFYRDLPQEFGLKDIELLKTLIELFAKQPGMIVNIEGLSRDLKRSKITIANYLEYLKYAMLIKEVKNLRPGFLTTSRKGKKIYPSTTALCFVFQNDFYGETNLQHTAETAAANHLDAQYYYKNGFEVDFIQKTNDRILPIEIKYGKPDQSQLAKFQKKFNVQKSVLVTKDCFQPNQNGIDYLPLWLFLAS
ncbi:MAG: ATP-binding protein [Patescibacteria group bacterium]|nr:ATP-binding protein [Patescibacteria group bacterium]